MCPADIWGQGYSFNIMSVHVCQVTGLGLSVEHDARVNSRMPNGPSSTLVVRSVWTLATYTSVHSARLKLCAHDRGLIIGTLRLCYDLAQVFNSIPVLINYHQFTHAGILLGPQGDVAEEMRRREWQLKTHDRDPRTERPVAGKHRHHRRCPGCEENWRLDAWGILLY
jgi:hypothetical protein